MPTAQQPVEDLPSATTTTPPSGKKRSRAARKAARAAAEAGGTTSAASGEQGPVQEKPRQCPVFGCTRGHDPGDCPTFLDIRGGHRHLQIGRMHDMALISEPPHAPYPQIYVPKVWESVWPVW